MNSNYLRWYWVSAFLSFLVACQPPDAQEIINRSIEAHGGDLYQSVEIEFDFRNRHYKIYHHQAKYQYERIFQDSTGLVRDVLNNDSFSRTVDEISMPVDVEWAEKYARSINSVAYFALLPYKLNDPAVSKRYLGQAKVKEQNYHKIEVTFQQAGGGEDHDDVFIYWIHPQTYAMEYLAYLYHTDEGGKRFRAPYNIRTIGGLRFADYINYEEPERDFPIAKYDSLFNADALPELSRIELKNIQVTSLQ